MKKTLIALLALAAPLTFAACGDDGTGPESSSVTLLLTDAPGDLVSAVVTIDGIYLQGGGEAEADAEGRVWLLESEVTTDLLTLSNDALTLVEDVLIPAGSYGQLRIVVSGGYIEVEEDDGSTTVYASPGYEHAPSRVDGTLQMPSFGQSGVKVNFAGALNLDDDQEVLLLDFDVSESFGRQAGASGNWVMSPVIHGADLELTSKVEATVTLAQGVELPAVSGSAVTLADFEVVLVDGEGNTKRSALTSSGGGTFTAEFPYLIPGTTWTLDLEGPAGLSLETDVGLPLEVTPSSGESTSVDITISAATVI